MENEPVVSLAMLPATRRQRRWAFAAIAMVIGACCLVAPFGKNRLPEAVGFIPAVQGAIFVTDLSTAIWLFTQVSLTRSRALLALANAYLFTALIVLAHTLTFPGAFAPGGLLGAGPQTAGWIYIIWHFSFPGAVIVYVALKDRADVNNRIKASTRSIVSCSAIGMSALVCGIVWGLTVADKSVPSLFLDRAAFSPLVFYSGGFTAVLCGTAFAGLAIKKRSFLDELLTISVAATTGEMIMVTFFVAGRYDVGWYAIRLFGVASSTAVFLALFTEFTRLSTQTSVALRAARQERENKLLSAQAAVAVLAHEIRQPLSALILDIDAGTMFLQETPPNLGEVRQSLELMAKECDHLNQTIEAIRKLFRGVDQAEQPIDLNEVVTSVLRSRQREFARLGVEIRPDLVAGLPFVRGQKTQIEEVVVNLVNNAADAMGTIKDRNRVLTVSTRLRGDDAVSVEIRDTGPGIDPKRLDEIFDAFVTTKSQGLGLGLAICRTIIENHGGELTASSDGQSGAAFQFVLPIMRPSGGVA